MINEEIKISNRMKKILLPIFVLSIVFSPIFVNAQPSTGERVKTTPLENPLGSQYNNIGALVEKVINFLATFLLAIAAFFIIYSGFKFVSAAGNPEKLKEAKDSLKNALIGTALILIASTVGKVIQDIITKLQ